MYQIIKHRPSEASWNKEIIVGQKLPLKLHEIWAILTRLQIEEQVRDLTLFNLAVDSKLRASDLVEIAGIGCGHKWARMLSGDDPAKGDRAPRSIRDHATDTRNRRSLDPQGPS